MTGARADHAASSGTFTLDGKTFEVDNKHLGGRERRGVRRDRCPHSVDDILAVVGERTVKAIVCTHAHDDHVPVAPALREKVVAPILPHPDDRPVWELTHTDDLWDVDLADGQEIEDSIRTRLFILPDETVVHTGHGNDTAVGTERARMAADGSHT